MKKIFFLLLFILIGMGIYWGGNYLHWDFSSLTDRFASKQTDANSGADNKMSSSSDSHSINDQPSDEKKDNNKTSQKPPVIDKPSPDISKFKKTETEKSGSEKIKSEKTESIKPDPEKLLSKNNDTSNDKTEKNDTESSVRKISDKDSTNTDISDRKTPDTSDKRTPDTSDRNTPENKTSTNDILSEEKTKIANSPELLQAEEDLQAFEKFCNNKVIQTDFPEDLQFTSGSFRKNIDAAKQASNEFEAKKICQQMRKALSDKKLEILEFCLVRLKNQAKDLQKIQKGLPDSVLEKLAPLVRNAKDLTEIDVPELKPKRQEFVKQLEDLQKLLEHNRPEYIALRTYDSVKGSPQETIDFINFFRKNFPDSQYGQDLEVILALEQAMQTLDLWNEFVLKNGAKLDQFAIDSETASNALEFCRQYDLKKFPLSEWTILKSRQEEFQAIHNVKTCQKITETFQFAGKTSYWICHRAPNQWLYLTAPPKIGANPCQTDLFGTEKTIILTEKELADIREARQTVLFRSLEKKTATIDDKIRTSDPGRWYSEWASIVVQIKNDELLDPIVKILYLKDICTILAASDYFFNQQLTPWIKVMNTSPFNSNVNWFDFEDPQTEKNRLNAKALLNFIDSGDLETVLSTAELNASVQPLAFVYRRVGWLDRDLTNKIFSRGEDLDRKDLPDGELFIIKKRSVPNAVSAEMSTSRPNQATGSLSPGTEMSAPTAKSSNSISGTVSAGANTEMNARLEQTVFSLQKIGTLSKQLTTLDPLPESIPRGMPVFLRFPVTASGSFAPSAESPKTPIK